MNRREFLRRLGIGAASVVASQALPEAEIPPASTLMPKPIAYGVSHPMTRLHDEEVQRYQRIAIFTDTRTYYTRNFGEGAERIWHVVENDAGE